jgi:hypothetical protein
LRSANYSGTPPADRPLSCGGPTKFRKAGRFDSFDAAITLVQEEFGWESNLEEYYGVKILHLQCGMTLAYDPTGKLSWASAPRLKQEAMGSQVEMEFISDSDPASASASSSPA